MKFRRAAVTFAVVLTWAGLGMSSPPSALAAKTDVTDEDTTENVDPLDDASVTSIAESLDVSADEARRRIISQPAAMELIERAYQYFGASYGGAWIDHEAGAVLHIGVTAEHSTVSVEQWIARQGLVEPGAYRAETVRFSYSQLETAYYEINQLRDLHGLFGVSMDEVTNRVIVDFDRFVTNPRQREQIVAQFEPGIIIEGQVNSATGEGEACDQPACDPPLRGSIDINAPGLCTIGFTVHARASSNMYVLTAGHCASTLGHSARHNGIVIGPVSHFLDSGNLDVARIGPVVSSYWNLSEGV